MLTEKIAKSSSRSKIFVSVSTIALVALATYNWAVSPQTAQLHAARIQQDAMTEAGKKAATIQNRINLKKTQIKELKEQITKANDNFFTEKTAMDFFIDLEQTSSRYNCTINSLNFDTEKNPEQSSSVTSKSTRLSLTGQYGNIIKFIDRLSRYPQRISIMNLFIEPAQPDGTEMICRMTITIYLINDK